MLLALAIILFVTIAVLPQLGLYRPVTVLSGSMRPTFSPGDTILVAPEPVSAVRVGQVVSYQVPVGYTRSRRTASCASCRAALTPLFRLRATRTIGPTHGRQSWKARPPGDR
ncbi:MAG: S24/S26 family peptidase [Solirubrobacteraceae bacterium]